MIVCLSLVLQIGRSIDREAGRYGDLDGAHWPGLYIHKRGRYLSRAW